MNKYILLFCLFIFSSCDIVPDHYQNPKEQLSAQEYETIINSKDSVTIVFTGLNNMYLKKDDKIYKVKIISESNLNNNITDGLFIIVSIVMFFLGYIIKSVFFE